jgi:hypothetical protein
MKKVFSAPAGLQLVRPPSPNECQNGRYKQDGDLHVLILLSNKPRKEKFSPKNHIFPIQKDQSRSKPKTKNITTMIE